MPTARTFPLPPALLIAAALPVGVFLCLSTAGEPEAVRPAAPAPAPAGPPRPEAYWNVDDLKPGMKGYGRTVMRGTKVETFQVEIIGVLKNTSPGRDLVLCRLSGLDLERSGIIAGMSGSPVYIDDKLVGAVAYGWSHGKDPIGGITPFAQMHSFVESYERRDLAEKAGPRRVGRRHSLSTPLTLGDRTYDSVTVSQDADEEPGDGLWLRPLRTPLAASGFSASALKHLSREARGLGLVPMQGGTASAKVQDAEKNVNLEPGGPLAISLVKGDFDLSGIGTVTHIDGNRVYGWGHPFMGLGGCDFPLMTGYIHTVYPRQTVSFKMGSPLRSVGVINADVSTCIAGWVGRKADMLPMRMTVNRSADSATRTFNVEIARQKSLLSSLVFTSLVNSVDMEGEIPDEVTAELTARIELEGHPPLVLTDTLSGYPGSRTPSAIFGQVAQAVSLLTNNPYEQVRINRIECETQLRDERRTADIEAVEAESEVYAPGDTVWASVYLRPYKGQRQRLRVSLKLPADLEEGRYTATLSDDLAAVRQEIRDNPTLNNPQDLPHVLKSVRKQIAARRTTLAVRLSLGATGVALANKALPDLPGSMVQILGHSRRSGAQTVSGSLIDRHPTDWVIQGQETLSFRVARDRKLSLDR